MHAYPAEERSQHGSLVSTNLSDVKNVYLLRLESCCVFTNTISADTSTADPKLVVESIRLDAFFFRRRPQEIEKFHYEFTETSRIRLSGKPTLLGPRLQRRWHKKYRHCGWFIEESDVFDSKIASTVGGYLSMVWSGTFVLTSTGSKFGMQQVYVVCEIDVRMVFKIFHNWKRWP